MRVYTFPALAGRRLCQRLDGIIRSLPRILAVKRFNGSEIQTNMIEGYFSIFKRGMKGVYQHCFKRHLHRYLAEFDFRYNERQVTDEQRSDNLLAGIVGKRVAYRHSFPAAI